MHASIAPSGAEWDCVAGPGAALADWFAPGYFPVPLRGHPIRANALFDRKQQEPQIEVQGYLWIGLRNPV